MYVSTKRNVLNLCKVTLKCIQFTSLREKKSCKTVSTVQLYVILHNFHETYLYKYIVIDVYLKAWANDLEGGMPQTEMFGDRRRIGVFLGEGMDLDLHVMSPFFFFLEKIIGFYLTK